MPWTRKAAPSSFGASSSKTRMNSAPIALRLASGSLSPDEPREEAVLGVDRDQRDLEVVAERGDDLLALVLAHQAVVDEHARQLVADRAVHEQRGHRRVDPAGEPADHAAVADLGADLLDLLLDDRGRAPRARAAADLLEERRQHVLAVGRVDDLGVELDAVEAALDVLERRDRRLRRARQRREAGRRLVDRVAVRHPARLLRRRAGQQPALARRPSAASARTPPPRRPRPCRRACSTSACMP